MHRRRWRHRVAVFAVRPLILLTATLAADATGEKVGCLSQLEKRVRKACAHQTALKLTPAVFSLFQNYSLHAVASNSAINAMTFDRTPTCARQTDTGTGPELVTALA